MRPRVPPDRRAAVVTMGSAPRESTRPETLRARAGLLSCSLLQNLRVDSTHIAGRSSAYLDDVSTYVYLRLRASNGTRRRDGELSTSTVSIFVTRPDLREPRPRNRRPAQ